MKRPVKRAQVGEIWKYEWTELDNGPQRVIIKVTKMVDDIRFNGIVLYYSKNARRGYTNDMLPEPHYWKGEDKTRKIKRLTKKDLFLELL